LHFGRRKPAHARFAHKAIGGMRRLAPSMKVSEQPGRAALPALR
jgi:hypothetical protein